MPNSKHTYDETKTLSSNLYLLEGYTFKGWSTSKNGSVVYNDEASILNLRESGSITLYAVWEANKYQIKYNHNKPLGSTGNIFGNMSNSNHTYDFTTALLDNEYFLNGYTFKGWSKNPNGTVDYKNSEKISNLTNENGDVVNLYAVWEANTYTVRDMLVPIFKDGKLVYNLPTLEEIRAYSEKELATIWDEIKRFVYPQEYYVDLSEKLLNLKLEMLKKYK